MKPIFLIDLNLTRFIKFYNTAIMYKIIFNITSLNKRPILKIILKLDYCFLIEFKIPKYLSKISIIRIIEVFNLRKLLI